jgi:hypothetical protein
MLRARAPAWSLVVWVGWMLLGQSARADLHFSEPSVHVGTVQSGTSLVHRFCFVNRGSDTVEITELRPSCGCLKPHLEQRFFKPGEEGTLDLEVNTLNQGPGEHTWSVQVQYRRGGVLLLGTLRLTARIITEVSVQPAALMVYADQAVGHEVNLTDQRPRPLAIAEVRTSSPELRGRVTEQFRDDMGHWVRKISLEVAADYPEGRHDEVVDIITDDPDYRDLKVPVTVVKRSRQRLTAAPNQVSLRVAADQAAPSRIVLLRDSDNEPVIVQDVEADNSALVCQWVKGPNNLATIRISVNREAVSKGGEIHGIVRVRVSKPLSETITIPVTCVPE